MSEERRCHLSTFYHNNPVKSVSKLRRESSYGQDVFKIDVFLYQCRA